MDFRGQRRFTFGDEPAGRTLPATGLASSWRRPASARPERGRGFDVAVHAAVAAAVALSLFWGRPGLTMAFGGVVSFVCYVYLGLREARRSPLLLSPLSFYFAWYAVALGLAAIYTAWYVRDGAWVPLSVALLPPRDVAYAYVMFLGGSVALHAGIQLFRPLYARAVAAGGDGKPGASLRVVALLWAAGILVMWKPQLIMAAGAPGRVLQWSGYAALAVLALQPRHRFRLSRLGYAVLMGAGTAGLFGVTLMSGSKAYLMYCLVPLLWAMLIRPRMRLWLGPLAIVLGVFYLGLLAPVVTMSRYTPLNPGETLASRLVDTFDRYTEQVRTGEPVLGDISMARSGEALLYRTFDTLPLAFILEEVRAKGLEGGSEMMKYAAYAFVPRILWPGKPAVTRGGWFAYYIGFADSPETSTTALGITAPGEFYWNFGLLGVLAGMFLVGCLLGGLWRLAGADPRQEPLRMLLYVMVMLNTPNMAEAVTVFVFIVSAFVTFQALIFAKQLLRASTGTSYVTVPARGSHRAVLPNHR